MIIKAPSRICLFGGGTDLVEYSKDNVGMVISMAVNTYTTVMDKKNGPNTALVDHICKKMGYGGPITTKYDGHMSSGMGSSASGGVATVGFIKKLKGEPITPDIITEAYQAELDIGIKTGIQDQAASYYGGFNLFIFKGTRVDRINIPDDIYQELWQNKMVLVHTGGKRHSSDLQQTLDIKRLDKVKELVKHGFDAIVSRDWGRVMLLLNEAWQAKKQSNPNVAGEVGKDIDRLVKKHKCGAKLMGAGGCGYVIFITENKEKLVEDLPNGWKLCGFMPDFKGLTAKWLKD
jgi:D-glycero-alpha-D-manno-heptose-7-phosphate kinase